MERKEVIMMANEKSETKPVTLRAIIVAVLMFAIFLPISEILLLYNRNPSTYYGFPLTFFWLTMMFYALGKVSNKLRLSVSEYAFVFVVVNILAGARGMSMWAQTENFLRFSDEAASILITGLFNTPALYESLVPEILFPAAQRADVVNMVMMGMSPGQIFPWAALAVPVAMYSIFTFLIMSISAFISFAILSPVWTDIEKLPFPIHALSAIEFARDGIEKRRIFNLKEGDRKVFWIFFLIGAIASLTPVLLELVPTLPLLNTFNFGETRVPILSSISSVLPGWIGYGWWVFPQFFIGLVVSNEALISAIVAYLVHCIYNVIAVQAGWYQYYVPGSEVTGGYWDLPSGQSPFPLRYMIMPGGFVGVGIILFWAARHRIKKVVNALLGKENAVEAGLSLRFVSYIGVASIVLFLGLFAVVGVPFIIGLMWLVMWICFYTAAARAAAVYGGAGGALNYGDWKVMYPVGSSLGYWPVDPPGNQAWFVTRAVTYGFADTMARGGGMYDMVALTALCHIQKSFNVNMKHVYIAVLVVAGLGTPLMYLSGYWFTVHTGGLYSVNSMPYYDMMMDYQGVMLAYFTAGGNFFLESAWFVTGIGISVGIYALKMFVPILPIDPTILTILLWNPEWFWMTAIASLVVKFVAIRIVGQKTFMEYAKAVVVGSMAGFGAIFTLLALSQLGLVAIPRFLSLYTP
jgi:hypothetical protein